MDGQDGRTDRGDTICLSLKMAGHKKKKEKKKFCKQGRASL